MFARKCNDMVDYSETDPVTIDMDNWQKDQGEILSIIYPAISDIIMSSKIELVETMNKHRRVLKPNSIPAGILLC